MFNVIICTILEGGYNMNTLNSSLNKGIPNDIELQIPFTDVINLSSNKTRTYTLLTEALLKYYEKISKIIGKNIKFYNTNKLIQIGTNPEDLGKYITISPLFITQMLLMNLNPQNIWSKIRDNKFNDIGEITDSDFYERLEKLKKTRNPKQLEREFPCIYSSYMSIIDMKNRLAEAKKTSLRAYMEFLKQYNLDKQDLEVFDSLSNISDFIIYTYDVFTNLLTNKTEIESLATEDKINARIFGMSSAERLELYIADTYVTLAKQPTNSLSYKQKCCYY